MDQEVQKNLEPKPSDLPQLNARVIELRPKLGRNGKEFRRFCRSLVKAISISEDAGRRVVLERFREEVQTFSDARASRGKLALMFACSVVLDMVAQGWEVWVGHHTVRLRAPSVEGVAPEEQKRRIRESHLLERDAQLREPSVQEFISQMEQRQLGPKGWVSIFSLMRDGRELAQKLRETAADSVHNRRFEMLHACIAPYLQVVESGVKCKLTGMQLTDVWRYFRHTWVSAYKSQPGRSMMVLIRDAGAPFHPVIGIAALGSSMAQQRLRDRWIGWDSESFVLELAANPTPRMARWINDSTQRLIDSIYIADFLKERLLTVDDLKAPTPRTIERLLRHAKISADDHLLNPEAAMHKNVKSGQAINWQRQAETPLFRSKRARTLAKLLSIRQALHAENVVDDSVETLKRALTRSACRAAVRQLVRSVKAEHVGVDMMDITVCGAVAPYNALLGGKLACLLLSSPEIVEFYRQRYGVQASIIASSMKGAPVVRKPNLVLLATTSLYGVGSSQYNRLHVPLEEVGGKAGLKIEYQELGISVGYGSYHFSQPTIDYLETLLGRAGDGRKVNSIFGEGVNPLMRKIREGLAEIGLPDDDLLKHGNSRVVYGIPLAENFRDVLLGLAPKPDYYLPLREASEATQKIADFWRRRWLSGRINRDGILNAVEKHTVTYPVIHGARVKLPEHGP